MINIASVFQVCRQMLDPLHACLEHHPHDNHMSHLPVPSVNGTAHSTNMYTLSIYQKFAYLAAILLVGRLDCNNYCNVAYP